MNAFSPPQSSLNTEKGLFTFYREQAEHQQKILKQIAKNKATQSTHKAIKKLHQSPPSALQLKRQHTQNSSSPSPSINYILKTKKHIQQLSDKNHTYRMQQQKVMQQQSQKVMLQSEKYQLEKSLIIGDGNIGHKLSEHIKSITPSITAPITVSVTPELSMKNSGSEMFLDKRKCYGRYKSYNFGKTPIAVKQAAVGLKEIHSQQIGMNVRQQKCILSHREIDQNLALRNKQKIKLQKQRNKSPHFQLPKLRYQSASIIRKRNQQFDVKQCYQIKDILDNNQKYQLYSVHPQRAHNNKSHQLFSKPPQSHQSNTSVLAVLKRYIGSNQK